MQCPECGLPRPAGTDPCPSCGAAAPAPFGGTRTSGGTSLRQWKERYQTGQLPSFSSGRPGPRATRQFGRPVSGPISPTVGNSNPDWGNEPPTNSIPPGAGLSSRRSGTPTPPSGTFSSLRKSRGLSSPSWPQATDETPPPPGRSSGVLTNPARISGAEFGNRSNSWKWQGSSPSSGRLTNQVKEEEYDDQSAYQDEEAAPMPQSTGSFRKNAMLPVPYQNRRPWNQEGSEDYGEMDEESGNPANLPVPLDMAQGSNAFPALSEEMLASRLPPGRKPPAFIPATRPRRPYRLSNYRIISGTISVILVTLLLGGAGTFFLVRAGVFQKAFGNKSLPPISYHFPDPTMPALGPTPQATPSGNQASKIIKNVTTAKNYTRNYDPINPTTTFAPGQTVNVLWQARNAKANDVISIKWYQNGTLITNLGDQNTKEVIKKDGSWNGVFGLAYPTTSVGKAELYYNGQLGWTIEFIISDKPLQTPTPPPVKGTTTPVATQTPKP